MGLVLLEDGALDLGAVSQYNGYQRSIGGLWCLRLPGYCQ